MEIRPAAADDLVEIGALIVELAEYERLDDEVVWTEGELRDALFGDAPAARVLVAEVDGEMAAFALYWPTFSTFLGRAGIWLEDLFVREVYRRRGIGTALLGELRSMTGGRVEWDVLDWNRSAKTFYEGLGARPVHGWTRYRWLPDAAR